MVKRLLICKSWRLRQIDPQETYKLQYLYFLPLNILPFLFFNEYFREGKWSALAFYARGRGEKHPFINMHEQNVIGSQTQLNDIAYEHTIISRQLFAGLMDSRPMKRKKNLHRMINNFRVFFFKHACLSSPYLMKYDRLLFCIINVYSIATWQTIAFSRGALNSQLFWTALELLLKFLF